MPNDKKIGFEIRTLNNLIRRSLDKATPPELHSATGIHGWAIGFFYEKQGEDVFQRDFEEHFSIRRSTATKILQLMEKNGLIRRESVKNDARLKKIVLTERATEMHRKIVDIIAEKENRLAQNISPDELDTFFGVIEKIKANLEVIND